MTREPKLLIGYGKHDNPVSGACSECGEWMPEDYPREATAEQILDGFAAHFRVHVREEHPRHM